MGSAFGRALLDPLYRQYALKMVEEIVAASYEIDELFYDIFGMQNNVFLGGGGSPFCYCPATVAAWNKARAGDDYRAGMATHDGWYGAPLQATFDDGHSRRHAGDCPGGIGRGWRLRSMAAPSTCRTRCTAGRLPLQPGINPPTGVSLGAIAVRVPGAPDLAPAP